MSAEPSDAVVQSEDLIIDARDARSAVAYLVVRKSPDYIAIMDVLESSVTDMSPKEIATAVAERGGDLDEDTIAVRLQSLLGWNAVVPRTDHDRIRSHADLLAANWRYIPTPQGRKVHRFYRTVLMDAPQVREVPLPSLARILEHLRALADNPHLPPPEVAARVREVFVHHDDLDGALVGAEDGLAGLADRFDLDEAGTAELKSLLVDYASHVAVELEHSSRLVHRELARLDARYPQLAEASVTASDARDLIQRGALVASRGSRVEDWIGLARWFCPETGRAARFALRLVRALPAMHANLRRLHTSTAGTLRTRALALARASSDPQYGSAVFLAAVGDHPWRKFSGVADDTDLGRTPSWRGGPTVDLPQLLRQQGARQPRGKYPKAKDGAAARAEAAAARTQRELRLADCIDEVLAARDLQALEPDAGRVALRSLMAAVQAPAVAGRRTAHRKGLACTLFTARTQTVRVATASWSVSVPGHDLAFHLPGEMPPLPPHSTPETRATPATAHLSPGEP
ncbi:MAG: DUF2397 domain-containing protein [Streptomycetaceae bacterium]|nr:DUF2397 domain-containing protein [Streptomycetaceae bacterium]